MCLQRRRRFAAQAVNDLQRDGGPTAACMREAEQARERLSACGAELPTWSSAVAGTEAPPQPEGDDDDDIESSRGWQWYASSVRESFFTKRVLLPTSEPSRRAMLLSQGGSGGAWLRAIPSEDIFGMAPLRFEVTMRRRLRWPLPLSRHTCRGKSCRAQLDDKGDHAASCFRSGLL